MIFKSRVIEEVERGVLIGPKPTSGYEKHGWDGFGYTVTGLVITRPSLSVARKLFAISLASIRKRRDSVYRDYKTPAFIYEKSLTELSTRDL